MHHRRTSPTLNVSLLGRDALCVVVSSVLAWAPLVAHAQPPVPGRSPVPEASGDVTSEVGDIELTEAELRQDLAAEGVLGANGIDREAVAEEAAERIAEHTDAPVEATPISLPGGETRSAVSAQAISLPTAEGSIEGMGESFAPILSSGVATFSVPIGVAPGRGGVQPSLSLAYSSAGGNGSVGFGWGIGAPFISRQTDRGLPRYVDQAAYHAEEDRFIYNGGQELVAVDSAAMAIVDQQAFPPGGTPQGPTGGSAAAVPSDVTGWQQYRARVEGGFMRFFRGPPDARGVVSSWVVQSTDGARFDFGLLPVGEGPPELATRDANALETDAESGTHVFRWMLTRMSDAHGSTIYYSYVRDRGQIYLDDVHYISPGDCAGDGPDATRACVAALASYGARVHFDYEDRGDAFTTYTSGYAITTALRLVRITITAHDDTASARTLVRRYHLSYQANSYHSLLRSVQIEGRPQTLVAGVEVGSRSVAEGSLDAGTVGPLLPPMTFGYSSLPTGPGAIEGFGTLASTVHTLDSSPPASIDEARADFMDVNSDGLPDLIITDPARYRTSDGEPAVGVFFNGFSGPGADPAVAGEFSDAVAMPMRSDLSGVLSLANLNIVPMDIDGDGRTDLLHMPRTRSYGWFAATREADPAGAPGHVSPADQGWRWTYATIDLPTADLDPRVDFGRDSQFIQTVDVNNDHLIDVVRTTGTSMQTWLNLGWVPLRDSAGRPAGDGRFGSARYDGTRWILSTEPTTSCLPVAGTPLDFEDPESRLSDMNGDGLVDLVRIRRGRVIWWPGRGLGSWGTGAHDCPSGFADGRYVEMTTPPAELNPELAGVQLADVDGDGATDVVQVRFDAVDVWFNRAGQSFTSRYTVLRTPAAPDFAPRVRLLDVDGSGTVDVVYANGDRWQYVDLLNHTQPRMLVSVDNGLGALTTIDYETSTRDYLDDLHDAASSCPDESAGCDRFIWSRVEGSPSDRLQRRAVGEPAAGMFHSAGTPVISTVVRRIRTSDRFARYSADQVSETQFGYHDGYYEGVEQEFRGFGAADAMTVGDSSSASVFARTRFHQGRRPQRIADDRLAHSEDEALKGREYLTETFDGAGRYLSSGHATLTTRTLALGSDGSPIQYAFISQSNEIRYDTTGFVGSARIMSLPDVLRETVEAGVISGPTLASTRTVRIRGEGAVMLRTTYDEVDNIGQVHRQTAHGRVPIPGTILPTDDPAIVSVTVPILHDGAHWTWRTQSSFVLDADGLPLRETTNTYSYAGALVATTQAVRSPVAYDFSAPAEEASQGAGEGLMQVDGDLVASMVLDSWGQPETSCVGADLNAGASIADCFRFATVSRATDARYDQLVDTETTHVARSGDAATLAMHGTWDRGTGVLLTATDPNGLSTSVSYDGFGRLTSVTPPAAEGCADGVATTRIAYAVTAQSETQPVSSVVTTTQLSCSEDESLTSIAYVDGLGRVRATLTTGPGGDEADWIRGGLARFNPKGAVVEAWQADFFEGDPPALASVLALPSESVPHTRALYDPFGRIFVAYAEDGSLTSTSFHALSTDVCDALDNDPGSLHFRTCTTARTDGHGRVIDQVLRSRDADGLSAVEHHRLWTYYRNDDVVLELVRAQLNESSLRPADPATAEGGAYPHVFRVFVYDSAGRRIGSDDPDTDDPGGAPRGSRSWRYLYNRASDLAAVRDPRGCGQNFYYDLGGRLLGEQYVGCGESQRSDLEEPASDNFVGSAVGMAPNVAGLLVDVGYTYDAYPAWVSALGGDVDVAPPTIAYLRGRATGVSDRAQRTGISYDARGNAVWTVREVAIISEPLTLAITPGERPTVVETLPEPVSSSVEYDEAHTYVRTAAFDHAGRSISMALPRDPDWDETSGISDAPLVRGRIEYDRRGLPARAEVVIGSGADATVLPVVDAIHYLRDGLVDHVEYGRRDYEERGVLPVITSDIEYDERRRPTRMSAVRPETGPDGLRTVDAISDQRLEWDVASNLTAVRDLRDPADWPARFRPQSIEIQHDSLYRVASALFDYAHPGDDPGATSLGTDVGGDWRADSDAAEQVDPMRPSPAPMISTAPPERVQSLVWSWDWLGNMTEWTDDAQQFYERSIGDITNGYELAERPSALYLASNVNTSDPSHSGWVELDYGAGGNVTAVTVHGQCLDAGVAICENPSSGDFADRREALRNGCDCLSEQHYEYRWDELNRISEALRLDREEGTDTWNVQARQRYRYDGANVRVVKESFDNSSGPNADDSRVALYVYPGHFERRGLLRGPATYDRYSDGAQVASETQYLVAGARIVWEHQIPGDLDDPPSLDRNARVTIPVSDLLRTTAASVDLVSGELLEVSTYYPNGARETLRVDATGEGGPPSLAAVPLEPTGFTGKEADEDVGLVYFGERYLLARLGRWASPDPLHIHAGGGGSALNSYHYVGGNCLQSRDPLGLQDGALAASTDGRSTEGDLGESDLPPAVATSEIRPTAAPPGWVLDDEWEWAHPYEGTDPIETTWYRRPVGSDEDWTLFGTNMSGDGASATDDTDYALDAVTIGGGAIVRISGRALITSLARESTEAVAREVLESAATSTVRSGARATVRSSTGSAVRGAITSAGEYAVTHGRSGVLSTVTAGVGGRIEAVRAVLTRAGLGLGTSTTRGTRAAASALGGDAGHLVASRLGGTGGFGNTVAMNAALNRGAVRVFEGRVARAIAEGGDVTLEVVVQYADDAATRPSGFVYSVFRDGEALFGASFDNAL